MNYDFDDFKKLYGMDNGEDNKESDDIFSSQFSELDELENDDSLYNELVPSTTYNLDDTLNLEKNIFENLNIDTPTTSDSIKQSELAEELENTMEIDKFEFDKEMEEILEIKEDLKKEIKPKRKWWHLPMTIANDHHLEYAFAHCAVLAFITAAMGTGFLTYIISHI